MPTLYEILGVSQNASTEDIERAYQVSWHSIKDKVIIGANDEEVNKAKALKQAYSVLSAPEKRAAYDAKLSNQHLAAASRIESESSDGFPWFKLIAALVIVVGAIFAYRWKAQKEETARIELQAAKAKAEAEQAQKRAEEEQARLAQKQLEERRRAEDLSKRETEKARYEAEKVSRNLSYAEERAERERARAEQQAKYEQMREEQMARSRVRQQQYDMERALARPIPRY